ncbi:MBL fold metallo-hydrolase [Pseudooceanicola sp. CBS1P-1]|uniref:Zn-dependent hydrolase n=1 Tax=Pseudooceanicola albus TaxID=2692189 RepID=A0A6L7G1D9_9RHOB|nr:MULTISPECIES: MBL fold metallo-hydrolase [Pseudooceanicola]MBT9382678.1 MBL fold metallo-hydrolase [Pseudooceanicola endophyticus]MXN17217.1 Zn-dependent hydrolase [Pseudooceanicola albus]
MIRSACLALAALLPIPLQAQTGAPVSHCIAIAQALPGASLVHRAAYSDPVPDYSVRLRYLTHSAYLIQSAGGVSAVTDYPGYLGSAAFLPDIVTMNHAHGTHFTAHPDPAIPHVLRGWSETFGQPADHLRQVGDMLVRNVSTDIRAGGGVEENGNSIFIFEVEGLCIGHLGHLHHEPNDAQYAAIGRLDVVMVPVDGGMTLDTDSMVRVVERLRSSLVLPMHWFSGASLQAFLERVSDSFAISRPGLSEVTLSLRDLPARPTILVLEPRTLSDPD